jgi:four helix bundle protein
MSNYEDLVVWKLAHEFVLEIYAITKRFPNEEKYRLTDQLCRAVLSIPLNICEGTGRNTDKDFVHFLYIARGSLHETRYILTLTKDLKLISNDEYSCLNSKCNAIGKMLNSLIGSICDKSKA